MIISGASMRMGASMQDLIRARMGKYWLSQFRRTEESSWEVGSQFLKGVSVTIWHASSLMDMLISNSTPATQSTTSFLPLARTLLCVVWLSRRMDGSWSEASSPGWAHPCATISHDSTQMEVWIPHSIRAQNSTVLGLAVQPDGKIIACGWFEELGGQARPGIGRLNADGSLDTTFVPAGVESATRPCSAGRWQNRCRRGLDRIAAKEDWPAECGRQPG